MDGLLYLRCRCQGLPIFWQRVAVRRSLDSGPVLSSQWSITDDSFHEWTTGPLWCRLPKTNGFGAAKRYSHLSTHLLEILQACGYLTGMSGVFLFCTANSMPDFYLV